MDHDSSCEGSKPVHTICWITGSTSSQPCQWPIPLRFTFMHLKEKGYWTITLEWWSSDHVHAIRRTVFKHKLYISHWSQLPTSKRMQTKLQTAVRLHHNLQFLEHPPQTHQLIHICAFISLRHLRPGHGVPVSSGRAAWNHTQSDTQKKLKQWA